MGSDEEGDHIAEEVNSTLFLKGTTIAIGALVGGVAAIVGSDAAVGCSSSCGGAVASGEGYAALGSGASNAGGGSPRIAAIHGSGVAGNDIGSDFLHPISIGSRNRPASIDVTSTFSCDYLPFMEKQHSDASLRHWSIIARVYY